MRYKLYSLEKEEGVGLYTVVPSERDTNILNEQQAKSYITPTGRIMPGMWCEWVEFSWMKDKDESYLGDIYILIREDNPYFNMFMPFVCKVSPVSDMFINMRRKYYLKPMLFFFTFHTKPKRSIK
jgi:hypothetical protein